MPASKFVEREVFVRRVGAAVGQREAEEQRLDAEHLLEGVHDRDAAAFADERDFAAGKGACAARSARRGRRGNSDR